MAREKSKQNKLKRLQDQLKAHIMQGDVFSGKWYQIKRTRKTRLLLEISRLERSK